MNQSENTKNTPCHFTLPEKITANWELREILYFTKTSVICYVVHKKTDRPYVLKTCPSDRFSRRRFRAVSTLPALHFVLPELRITHRHTEYLFYPRHQTFKQALYTSGLYFEDLLSLGVDLSNAVCTLIDHQIYEADISPNNIYLHENGTFCLGDLNLEKTEISGTSPFLAPEQSLPSAAGSSLRTRRSAQEAFDHAMQYNICKLLDALCKLQKALYTDSLRQLLQKGLDPEPSQRFPSLRDFQNALLDIRKSEQGNPGAHLILHRENHPLFRVKTQPVPKNGHPVPIYLTGILLMISVIFFIVCLQRYQKSYSIAEETLSSRLAVSSAMPAAASAFPSAAASAGTGASVADASADAVAPSAVPLHSSDSASVSVPPAGTDTSFANASAMPVRSSDSASVSASPADASPANLSSAVQELDIQGKDYYALDTILRKTRCPEKISCLYAGQNHFRQLSGLSAFDRLKELYADNNELSDLSGIRACTELEILVLSYNTVTDVSPLSDLSHLTHLDLSSNPRLTDLRPLESLSDLRTLNISDTGVRRRAVLRLQKKLPDCDIISPYSST